MICLVVLWMALGDLQSVKAVPDLEKRSEMALANADAAIDGAKKAYSDGDEKAEMAALAELQASVDVSYDALQSSKKEPRRSKYYKQAELKVQALTRRLRGFRDQVGFETKESVDAAIKHLSDVHDRLIEDIMSKKKR